MANATPVRLGANMQGADKRELFLKVFTGEVMSVYNNACVLKDKVRTRTLSAGKSASFAAIGKTKAAYHTPGAEITGDQINLGEKVVTVDDLLIAATFVSKIDEAMNHFEVRGEFSKQMGEALAMVYDRNLLSLAVKAARDTGAGGLGKGTADQGDATSYKLGTVTPTLQQKIDGLYAVAQKMDENNIPESGRWCFVSPATYWQFVTSDKLLNRDFGGANGVYSDGTILKVAGLNLIKTNNLSVDHTAAGNIANYPDYSNKYAVNAADTVAMCIHESALATVKLMDVSTEMEWDIRRQGTLMVAKMALGHGVIRPDGLFEVRAAV